jgi:hypothetical protein
MKKIYQYYPHILVLLGFILISIVFFYPILQGKKIYQSDIVQYTGMAKAQNDFREKTGEELFWTDSAFLGMPTYQLGAHYPYNYIKKIDATLRFLPRPADYLFLYFVSFYLFMLTLGIKPLKAFFGALIFGFSTYLIVIFGAGHNAKAHAIAYMPLVLAGIVLVFKKRYIVGGILTMLAVALEINANHFQMTYYLLFVIGFLGLYYVIRFIQEKEYKHTIVSITILFGAALLAVGTNATSLLATAEFSEFSIRNKSELSFNADGTPNRTNSSMDYDYITEYSYGISESFNLIFPRLFGGGISENLGDKSLLYQYALEQGASNFEAKKFASKVPTYWGDQPIVEAPAYIGSIVFFLAIFCLLADKRNIKYVFFASIILSLLLSWGKNFPLLTNLFIDYVPMYDKFRAVSSIQVILELCMPILAIMGLETFFKLEFKEQTKYLTQTSIFFLGIVILLFVCKDFFSYTTMRDQYYSQTENGLAYLNTLVKQRKLMYTNDLWRSLIYVSIVIGILYLSLKRFISLMVATLLIGVVMIADLVFIDKNYVNKESFVNAKIMNIPFEKSQADQFILRDTSHYRVYNPQGRLQGKTNYFHKSVGGYSAVRPQKADQVFIYQVEPYLDLLMDHINQDKMVLEKSLPVLDMLNVKYLLFQTQNGVDVPIINPFANGAAWFVDSLKIVNSADQEMKHLTSLNVKTKAIVNGTKFPELMQKQQYILDSLTEIKLEYYQANYLKYSSNNSYDGFAVFSEVYYNKGWNAYIDNELVPHYEVNYLLRGLSIPAGEHIIEFKFEPKIIKTGSIITVTSFIIILVMIFIVFYFLRKNKFSKN